MQLDLLTLKRRKILQNLLGLSDVGSSCLTAALLVAVCAAVGGVKNLVLPI